MFSGLVVRYLRFHYLIEVSPQLLHYNRTLIISRSYSACQQLSTDET